jgi:NAD(P)-dependent dehydrogenase (short-subunit alcohol dehydrogenase family)
MPPDAIELEAAAMNQPISLEGRIAVVTGATRGIGRASALALAGAGAHVIAVGRTQGALEELDDEIRAIDGPRATIVALDLMNGDSIDALGYEIFQRHRRLDILVHAAAMLGGLFPVAHIDPKLWDKLVATNLNSAYRLIRAMEPLLRQSEAGRALFLTTGQGVRKRAFWGGYAATKAALDTIVRCWADEVEHTNIRAAIIDPGVMRTRMRAQAFPGEDPSTLVDPAEIGPMIVAYAGAAELGLPVETARFSEWRAARTLASA